MRYWKAISVGIVQGLTEFLPVSSSGHLAILARLGIAPTSVFFNLALHLATLFAVLVVMRRELSEMIRHPIKGDGKYVALACVPTVAIAFLFKKFLPDLLLGSMLGFGFLLTGTILFLSETFCRERKGVFLGAKVSLWTGVMQGFAVLPGVSRSGSTIAALRFFGVDYDRAAKFSFLLALPVIVGGFLLEGIECGFSAEGAESGEIVVAAIAAFLSGLIAVRFMLKQTKKGLKPFIPYVCALGVLCYFLP